MIATIALAGCGDDPVPLEPDPPEATTITISPDAASLTFAGETAQFTASVTDQNGDPFDAPVSRASSDADVFAVDANGLVSAAADGSGMVTASVGELSASATVVVDSDRNPIVVMGGKALGTSTLTTTATDPGGLSASVDINLAVNDRGPIRPASGRTLRALY